MTQTPLGRAPSISWRLFCATLGTAALLATAQVRAQAADPGEAARDLPRPGTAATRQAPAGAEPASVESPWVRATVAGQRSTGAFLRLTARNRLKLVAVESPVADIVEIHEMALVDNVMRMRAVETIELAPGQSLELRPGGFHVMLIDLRQQVKVGDPVPLTLVFEDEAGSRVTQSLTAPVRALTAGGKPDPSGTSGNDGMDHGGRGQPGPPSSR
jgi:copper(I)-binding protein